MHNVTLNARPTIMLVHDAFADLSSWSLQRAALCGATALVMARGRSGPGRV
jgi:hypothetical protein